MQQDSTPEQAVTHQTTSAPSSSPSSLLGKTTRRGFLKQSATAGIGLIAYSLLGDAVQAAEPAEEAMPERYARSLWDGMGRLVASLPKGQYDLWKQALRKKSLTHRHAALLHLWVGEYELSANEEPIKAGWHFRKAKQLTRPSDHLHGWATYNGAVTLYYNSQYEEAAKAFHHLLRSKDPVLIGFSRRSAAHWFRLAGARSSEFNRLGKMGIPRPPALDPICGAGSLAVCLKVFKLPHDKKRVLATVRFTGRGSNLQDLVDACPKLGLVGRAVHAPGKKALLALPKPLVAYVEQDHFVAVIDADEKGVVYSCTDCGHWPGGRVRVSWKQWEAMLPGIYLAVAQPSTPEDLALGVALGERNEADLIAQERNTTPGIQVAALGLVGSTVLAKKGGALPNTARALAAKLTRLVQTWQNPQRNVCGTIPQTKIKPKRRAKKDADPVDLSTGEESYACGPDLVVYNPNGPDIVWARNYRSLRGFDPECSDADFGTGWSHSYNICVYDPTPAPPTTGTVRKGGYGYLVPTGTTAPSGSLTWEILYNSSAIATSASPNGWAVHYDDSYGIYVASHPFFPALGSGYEVRVVGTSGGSPVTKSASFSITDDPIVPTTGTKYLVYADGSRIAFTNSALPDAMQPVVNCAIETGHRILIQMCYDAGDDQYYYLITFGDRTQWVTTYSHEVRTFDFPQWFVPSTLRYGLAQIKDGLGNGLKFIYGQLGGNTLTYFPLLEEIHDLATDTWLMGIYRENTDFGITHIGDCYDRQVQYQVTYFDNLNPNPGWVSGHYELTRVSQVLEATASFGDARYEYGYTYVKNGEMGVDPNNDPAPQEIPLLHEVYEPRQDSMGSLTMALVATINYEDDTCFVSNVTDPYGTKHSYALVDSSGTPTALGDYAQVTIEDSSNTVQNVYTVQHNSGQNLTLQKDGSGVGVVNATYGSVNSPADPTIVEDGEGRQTEYTYDNFGSVLTITTPRSLVSENTYDYSAFPLGELASTVIGSKPAIEYTYYSNGLLHTLTAATPDGGTGTTTYAYDSLGNIVSIIRPGTSLYTTRTLLFDYTTDGSYTQAAMKGQPLTTTDNANRVTHFRYDSQGRVVQSIDAEGNQTNYTYNIVGQVVTTELPATGQTGSWRGLIENEYLFPGGPCIRTIIWDENGNFVKERLYRFGLNNELREESGSVSEAVRYEFDAYNRPAAIFDGNNNCLSYYGYTDRDLLWYEAFPDMPTTGNTVFRVLDYNNAGQIITRTEYVYGSSDPPLVINYEYNDPDGLMSAILYPATSVRDVSFQYDGYGRLEIRTDATGTQEFAYGDANELLSVETTYTGLSAKTIGYTYNKDGSRASMTTPAGNFSYQYGAAGLLDSLTNPYAETTNFQYDAINRLTLQVLANSVQTEYGYNPLNQLLSLVNRIGSGGGATLLSEFTVPSSGGYDAAGNRLSQTANLPTVSSYSGATSYSYDAQNRLTEETSARLSGYTDAFGYDNAGNLTTFKGASRSYDNQNQRTGTGFAYDLLGNPTTYNGLAMTFTPEGQATAFGSLLTADYTTNGLRAWKENSVSRTYFLYDGTTPVLEMSASGVVLAVNTFGPGGLVSRRLVATSDSIFYTFDERGNTTQRLSASQVILSSHMADAFGAMTSTLSSSTDPYDGFGAQHGYYTDHETGAVLCTHRYYDSGTGRWLTRDPLSYPGGVNLYAYCQNNPILGVDPLGLQQDDGGPLKMLGQFLTGLGSKSQSYTAGSEWLGEVMADGAINVERTAILVALIDGANAGYKRNFSKSLSGEGIARVLVDGLSVFSGGLLTPGFSDEISYLGSYSGTWRIKFKNPKRGIAVVEFHVWNETSAPSGSRVPGVGYAANNTSMFEWYAEWAVTGKVPDKWIGSVLPNNPFSVLGPDAPLSTVRQDFHWEEVIRYKSTGKGK